MNDDRFQRLSEYLDGELSEPESAALEQALETDAELAGLLEQLREVKRVAGDVDDRGPETDLWPAIAARIDAERVVELKPARDSRRRLTFTVPQFAAAMIATLVMGTGALWMASSLGEFVGGEPAATVSAETPEAATASPRAAELPVRLVESAEPRNPSRKSDVAIAALEARLAEGRDNLDSSTVRIIEESLATIDRAIESASAALEADPGNVWLNRHLADSKSRKVRLLEKAAALTAVRT
ncbi:MAG: zf-HC2 domain-containing protein [marine benthic group bacterium]|nr:zf-HC2 domain-containing protein [Gemmatimonadota bacterium]